MEERKEESNFSSNQKYKLLPIVSGAKLDVGFFLKLRIYIPND